MLLYYAVKIIQDYTITQLCKVLNVAGMLQVQKFKK